MPQRIGLGDQVAGFVGNDGGLDAGITLLNDPGAGLVLRELTPREALLGPAEGEATQRLSLPAKR